MGREDEWLVVCSGCPAVGGTGRNKLRIAVGERRKTEQMWGNLEGVVVASDATGSQRLDLFNGAGTRPTRPAPQM